MGRFVDADEDVTNVVSAVREQYFPELASAEIKVIMDQKKRMSGGKIVLGRMKKTNELERHLSANETGTQEGYDYIMYLDELTWNLSDPDQRKKLVRHELRHCEVDNESNTTPYKVKGHDIEDFEDEIRLNADDPGWANRLGELVKLEYEAEAERRRG
jgi:hypothetical protein